MKERCLYLAKSLFPKIKTIINEAVTIVEIIVYPVGRSNLYDRKSAKVIETAPKIQENQRGLNLF